MQPKISVALCTFNGEKFIREQIDSLLNQTLQINEIIVCDDCSTDETIAILKEYALNHPGLFFIHQNEKNLRSVKNFEKAISLCTGDFIFLSDQDDIWVADKAADFLDYFEKHPKISVLASNGYCIDGKSEILERYTFWDIPEFLRTTKKPFSYYTIMTSISNLATGATMALRKEFLSEVLPFPLVNLHHDEWIAIIASKINAFELLNKKYIYYRLHENQQVGGISFRKNNAVRKKLTEVYDVYNFDTSFKNFRKRLRKLVLSHKKDLLLRDKVEKYSDDFSDNAQNIRKLYELTKAAMKKKYAVSFRILTLIDNLGRQKYRL